MSLEKIAEIKGARLIFDLNHAAYRNWAANPTLATSRGEPSGAIFGTLKSIVALSQDVRSEQIICVKDTADPFRRAVYPAYKAHRTDENRTPLEIVSRQNFFRQLNALEPLLEAAGIPVIGIAELEADDLAALIAQKISFTGTTILVSGDRDFIQLVRPGTALYSPIINKLLSHNGPEFDDWGADGKVVWEKTLQVGPRTFTRFCEKLPRGIPLDRWLLYRAMVGDHSDNLPGVPGIGPAAALKVVEAFCSIEVLKEAGETHWRKVLNKRQTAFLAAAFQNGDFEQQYRLIDLSSLPRTEGSAVLANQLADQMQKARVNEKALRSQLIQWEMSSLLLNWRNLLKALPAYQRQTPDILTRGAGVASSKLNH